MQRAVIITNEKARCKVVAQCSAVAQLFRELALRRLEPSLRLSNLLERNSPSALHAAVPVLAVAARITVNEEGCHACESGIMIGGGWNAHGGANGRRSGRSDAGDGRSSLFSPVRRQAAPAPAAPLRRQPPCSSPLSQLHPMMQRASVATLCCSLQRTRFASAAAVNRGAAQP